MTRCDNCGLFVSDIFTHAPQCDGKDTNNRSQPRTHCMMIHRRAEQDQSTHEIAEDVGVSMQQVRRHLHKDCSCETEFVPKKPEHGRWVKA